ncbi:Ubiquitin carboxyl-terminal hydrolase 15 [Zea mays]|uniref:Ubiquitin carboxyl-terminal hydrolase 15 n=1 Tax=Zea mays TaxID=4577 RepID=A0A1D6H5V0_MAIZE|nr:Ubiquitin carboxyl-terminal hydrolase 15 [Zea mays]
MLQPREADVPALFLVFIVLPVVAYFLLGRWHDSASKKARASVLAQRAAEEAYREETMACPDIIPPGPSLRTMPYFKPAPSLRQEYHECATCHAPAKTRCSRCKSVRYCSGKCQIVHWRQGHKETCQKWLGSGSSSFGGSSTEATEQMPFLANLNSPLPDLDGDNMYKCGRCSAYVKARKQLSVHEVPNILTVVLKRFQSGKYGKINKCVTFPDMLDMVPFVTGSGDNPPLYFLYAVVVHVDTENASFSGHYISYVKDMQGTWLRIDDSEVQVVSVNQVMSEGAYMLFYLRSFPRPPRIYIEKGLPVTSAKRHTSKSSKGSKHDRKQTELLFPANDQAYGVYDFRPDGEGYAQDQHAELRSRAFHHADDAFADSVSADFSEATSSEWSLFTSSDESSFTTESTRDSFSVVDYGDNAGLDPISSIFGPSYAPEHGAPGSFVSRTRFSPSSPQTRYFSESTGFVSDSSMPAHPHGIVHRGRYPDSRACASSAEPLASAAHQRSGYGRYPLSRDGFVQTSGFCQM